MMEAKLRQMDASKPDPTKSAPQSALTGLAALPAKPPPPLPTHLADALPKNPVQRRPPNRGPLPSLPLAPHASANPSSQGGLAETKPKVPPSRQAKAKLVGVKMMKPKEKLPGLGVPSETTTT